MFLCFQEPNTSLGGSTSYLLLCFTCWSFLLVPCLWWELRKQLVLYDRLTSSVLSVISFFFFISRAAAFFLFCVFVCHKVFTFIKVTVFLYHFLPRFIHFRLSVTRAVHLPFPLWADFLQSLASAIRFWKWPSYPDCVCSFQWRQHTSGKAQMRACLFWSTLHS